MRIFRLIYYILLTFSSVCMCTRVRVNVGKIQTYQVY